MSRIVRLPEDVANQIAAGEVVERPASVAKEILENAIDAGAQRIEIDVEGGGVDLIRIRDDGHGMTREEAELSLERHATSKIRSAHDLTGVLTFGFRGEAIPSIASVSRFRMVSRTEDATEGTEVVVEGGKLASIKAAGAPVGTSVEVRDLFFNLPARRKFLKRPQTELNHVSDAVERLALARPELSVRMRHQGRVLIDAPRVSESDPQGRLARILGKKTAGHLYPMPEPRAAGPVTARGWVSSPEHSERSTRGLYVFVNGRFVRDRTILHAIQSAYREVLESGRHPVVVLFLEVDAGLVDINVHPQKTEVRFSETGIVHRVVSGAISAALVDRPWEAEGDFRLVSPDFAASPEHRGDRVAEAMASFGGASPRSSRLGQAWDGRVGRVGGFGGGRTLPSLRSLRYVAPASPLLSDPDSSATAEAETSSAGWEPVAQLRSGHLVVETADRVVLIDVRRALQKKLHADFEAALGGAPLARRPLLFPHRFSVPPRAADALEGLRESLERLGLEVRPLDGDEWRLVSVPEGVGGLDLESTVNAIVACATDSGSVDLERLLEALTSTGEAPQLDPESAGRLVSEVARGPERFADALVQWAPEDLDALFEGR